MNLEFISRIKRERDYGHFKLKQKFFFNLLSNFVDSKRTDYLDYAFPNDIKWVVVSVIGNKYVSSDKDVLEPIVLSTGFMKPVSGVTTYKAVLE